MLRAAGICTPEELDKVGAVEAYRRALDAGAYPSLNFLWAPGARTRDLEWRDLPEDRKADLRKQVNR